MAIAKARRLTQTQCPTRPPNSLETMRNPSRGISNSFKDDLSNRRTLNNSFPLFDDNLINPTIHSIPMATFQPEVTDRQHDSSNSSSGGLREFLFPPLHEGEIIYERPPKVVAYAGQVFAASQISAQKNSNSERKASRSETAGRNSDSANTSLDWDYFDPRRRCASYDPSTETGHDGRKAVNVCWV
ncbi:uncharacterized protein NPIL_445291 [Nephila pilipes]|uniref:Uncharacterized protein n=1 Tax=Nephila pilipes TaxID=299642 RepID=A0A8X6UB27_NEPPI|nr:uncharacterized protein NPIL_445291 [Nephila pilipes]